MRNVLWISAAPSELFLASDSSSSHSCIFVLLWHTIFVLYLVQIFSEFPNLLSLLYIVL